VALSFSNNYNATSLLAAESYHLPCLIRRSEMTACDAGRTEPEARGLFSYREVAPLLSAVRFLRER